MWRLIDLMEATWTRHGHCRIVDLGGRAGYWRALGFERLTALGAHITLVNVEPEPERLTTRTEKRLFTAIQGDACALPQFRDGAFDIVHSNSVIEHVGGWARMQMFAGEARRLAPSYYVQTPDFWFPIEPHFLAPGFHWLPFDLRVRWVQSCSLGHIPRLPDRAQAVAAVKSARLLTRGRMIELFPDAEMLSERYMRLSKSLIAIRGAGRMAG